MPCSNKAYTLALPSYTMPCSNKAYTLALPSYTMPCASMALATFMKPATLAPFT